MSWLRNYENAVGDLEKALAALEVADHKVAVGKSWLWAEEAARHAEAVGVVDASEYLGSGRRPKTSVLREALNALRSGLQPEDAKFQRVFAALKAREPYTLYITPGQLCYQWALVGVGGDRVPLPIVLRWFEPDHNLFGLTDQEVERVIGYRWAEEEERFHEVASGDSRWP